MASMYYISEDNMSTLETLGKNFLDELDPTQIEEIMLYLEDAEDYLDSLNDLKNAMYGYSKIADWWDELDRCYECRPKLINFKTDYKGWSNFVLNDFHDAINKVQNRMKNVFAGLDKKFTTISESNDNAESAEAAKFLVRHSMRLCNLEAKSTPAYYDLANYGNAIVHTPLKVVEYFYDELNDFIVDKKTGKPVMFNGEPLQGDETWKQVSQLAVYTDFIVKDPRSVKQNPHIADIKRQDTVFCKYRFTVPELQDMDGEELSDIEEFLKEEDDSKAWEEMPEEETLNSQEPYNYRTRTVSEVYFYYRDLKNAKNKKLKKYILVRGNDRRALSIKECVYSTFPFRNAQFAPSKFLPAYGVGPGQTIYSSFLALCTRINQGYDKRTMEIIPGGIKDSTVPTSEAVPGLFHTVPGLSQMPSPPILTWTQMMGQTSQLDRLDIDLMKSNIQFSIPNLLGGTPTGTQADRTASGLDLLVQNAYSNLDANFIDIEDRLFGGYAEDAYNNYCMFFRLAFDSSEAIFNTLQSWIGKEKMEYTDDGGQVRMIDFTTSWAPVHFSFAGARATVEQLSKMQRIVQFVDFISAIGKANPEYALTIMQNIGMLNIIKDCVRALDIGDVSEIFNSDDYLSVITNLQNQAQSATLDASQSHEILQGINEELIGVIAKNQESNPIIAKTAIDLHKFIKAQYERIATQSTDNRVGGE